MTTENENEDEDKTLSGPQRRLSDEDFAHARELYELGKSGIPELAKEYGVSRQALFKRFKDLGIVRGSRAHELVQASTAATKAVVERFAEKRAELIEETNMEAVKSFKQVRMIGQKIMGDAVKASTVSATKIDLSSIDDDMRALGRYNKILVDNFNTVRAILGADEHIDEADLPILTIEDLTDQDILDHHISTGALDENATLEDINTELSGFR